MMLVLLFVVGICCSVVQGSNDRCESCETAENKTEEEISKDLGYICDVFPGFAEECKEIIDDYIPLIITFLEAEFTPNVVCELLTFCPKPELKKDTAICLICDFFVVLIESYLAENQTIEEIVSALDYFCGYLPNKLECQEVLGEYVPEIIRRFLDDEQPEHVCGEIGICVQERSPPKPKGETPCQVCLYAVGWVEYFLRQNSTEEDLEDLIDKFVCPLFKDKQTCEEAFMAVLPDIIDFIEQELPAQKICEIFLFCSSSISFVGDQDKCDLCLYITGLVEECVKSGDTDEQIEEKAKVICTFLPKTLSEKCHSMLTDELSQIISLVRQGGKTADEICKEISYC